MKNQKLFLLINVLLFSSSIFAQIKITGKVLDEGGFPLPGANVIELNTQNGTTTDFDGKFTLTTKSDTGKITISFIGYRDQDLIFSPTINEFQNVQLSLSNNLLGEVVVIGYGTQKKQDLSSAIANIKLEETIKSRPSTNLESLLQGQLAGVTIQTNGGNPFDESTINIRGKGSFADDSALYVVDGVPNAPFNVEDVESVSVLKDGASASIYGAYVGANGVVIITTKKAKKGLQLSFNSSKGVSSVTKLPTVLSAGQYVKVMKDAYSGSTYPSFLDNSYFQKTRTNWFDEIFRDAFIDHHAISVSGGSDKVKAFGSFSYDKREGVLINTYKEIFGAMLKVDFEATKWLTLSERLSYKNENGQGAVNTSNHEGVIAQALMFPRSSSIFDYKRDGSVILDEFGNPSYHGTYPRELAGSLSPFGEFRNPYATLKRLNEYRPTNRIFSTTGVAVEPISDLVFKSEYTFGLDLERFESFTPKITEPGNPNLRNFRFISDRIKRNWLWENTINYKKRFDEHSFDMLTGYTAFYEKDKFSSVNASGFTKENGYGNILSQAGDILRDGTTESIVEDSRSSFLARLLYNYADRYFLTASIRNDKTSRLPKKKRSGWFSAVSGAWKISSEPFFSGLNDKVNLLKLRASWGQIGNVDAVDYYVSSAALRNSSWFSYFGDQSQSAIKGIFQRDALNDKLTWETTEQFDIGLDARLFNSLDITVDYFDKRTKDLITRGDVASVSGLGAPLVNIGDVSNKGVEIGVKFNDKFKDFNYSVYGNFMTVKSVVLDLDRENFRHNKNVPPFLDLQRSKVSEPWFSHYLVETDGVFQTQEEIDNYVYTNPATGATNKIQPNAQPGDLKFVDFNNDGEITGEDRTYLGSYLPEITYSFGASADYKGFDFSFFFQGVANNKIFNAFKVYELNARSQQGYYSTRILNSWDYNKNSGIPRLSIADDANRNYQTASDFFLEDGSYLRLKNITLGYTFPKSLMRNLGVEKAKLRLYLNAENVHTFTNYSGIDPEVGNDGIDAGKYPLSRTYSFGLNFNF